MSKPDETGLCNARLHDGLAVLVNDDVQLISDGDGLAVIGAPPAVARFLSSEGPSSSREINLPRLSQAVQASAGGLHVASVISEQSGRWIKITKQSADLMKKLEPLRGKDGVLRAVLVKPGGSFAHQIQIAATTGGALLNPIMLANLGGVMSQMAMQQSIDEINEYLKTIDAKLDDVLRNQKDAVLADMIGVDFAIEDAMIIREQVGSVSDVTWSKVQGTSTTLNRTQAYAVRQLDALAKKIEGKTDVGELADSAREVEAAVGEWLAVLARCFQLQDALSILELDRVLGAAPDELDRHRAGVRLARENRLRIISNATGALLERMADAAEFANKRVILNPRRSPAVVAAGTKIAVQVGDFRARLGLDRDDDATAVRGWLRAVGDVRDAVVRSAEEKASAVGAGAAAATNAFRRVDLDGDGVADEARAVTAFKEAQSRIAAAGEALRGEDRADASRSHADRPADEQEPQ